MSTTPQPQPGPGPGPGQKKTSPWIFVLIGCGGIIVISGIIMVALGMFAVNKAKEAGLDPELLREQPALAAGKMIAAADPDIEVVDVDEGAGRITFRQLSTGKTVTMDAEDIKEGRIRFESDEGEVLSLEATPEGESGGIRMRSSEGSLEFGGGSDVEFPGWIQQYPDTQPRSVMKTDTPQGRTQVVMFTTSDSVGDVIAFYKQAFEDEGLTVSTMEHGGGQGGAVNAKADDGSRQATVAVGTGSEGTTVNLSYTEK